MRGLFIVVGLTLAAAPALAQAAEPKAADQTVIKKKRKRLPRIIARALGIVTSTVVQTEAQPPPRPPRNYFSLIPEPLLIAELETRHSAPGPFSARVERVSRGLLGAPYLLGALGEGAGTSDPDPRYRLDAFDCTTLVETVIALAHHEHPRGVARLLDQVRYTNGKPDFDHRRHLMTSQWIPELVKEGWLKDITRQVGESEAKTMPFKLSERRWKRRHIAKALVLPDESVPRGTFDLDYLPTAAALSLAARIPSGTIFNIVHVDWQASPDLITHQGLIITRPGSKVRYVRHASPISKRVVDVKLTKMLQRYIDKPGRWRVVGLNLLQIASKTPALHNAN